MYIFSCHSYILMSLFIRFVCICWYMCECVGKQVALLLHRETRELHCQGPTHTSIECHISDIFIVNESILYLKAI